ncbi:hypothetical protein, partial [Frankia sp. CpI1-P]
MTESRGTKAGRSAARAGGLKIRRSRTTAG